MKIMVSDVDGTLIDHQEGRLESFDQLADIVNKGENNFTIATGRCYSDVKAYIEKFHIDLPVVINNGAACVLKDKIIWSNGMNGSLVKEAILLADSYDMGVFISDGHKDRSFRHNAYAKSQVEKYDRYAEVFHPESDTEWKDSRILKILFVDPQTPGRVDEIIQRMGDYARELNIVRYNDRSMDVMLKGSSKATGIKKMLEIAGENPETLVTIGDALNDLEMTQYGDVGCAVNNAELPLKEHADYICEGETSSGVLEAFKKFILKGEENEK